MRGKPTFRNGRHPSRAARGGLVHLRPAANRCYRLAKLAGGDPPSAEHAFELERGIALHAVIWRARDDVPSADVRATLGAIAKLAELEARAALANCDDTSATLIGYEMLSGASIQSAAAKALRQFSEPAGRKPHALPLFARFAWNAWLRLGGSPDARPHVAPSNLKASPLLAFAIELLGAVTTTKVHATDMAKAMRAAKGRAG